ncbi:MAG TPA: tRNA pseudouridine(13) synthase TruD [Gemmataceae bacterium]|nr:tRNA pseudouridine(13) synthase TruD [Gemmataceae bacterium]
MKLKQQPDDFQVEELTDVVPSDGPHALYRLEKRGWTTPDALAAVRRRWRIEPRRISYGGLKDRHAATVQYLTIFHGPRRNLCHHDIAVQYLGQVAAPYRSRDIRSNRFRLTLRDLPPDVRLVLSARLALLAREGVPNYFDDQRFGSVAGAGSEFIARLLVQGRFEEALRLALTAPYEFDRSAQKAEKRLVQQHWGDWQRLKAILPHGHARSLVDYLLLYPNDFRGAVARLRPELTGLYLSAYQSHLWNRMLAGWLRMHLRPEQLRPVELRLGVVPFHQNVDAEQLHELSTLQLPLPSARSKLEEGDPRAELVHTVLAEEGVELREMQIKGIRRMFFSRGERAALCLPRDLTHELAPDENHRGRDKLTLGFELPRGSYATLFVKAIDCVIHGSENLLEQ